MSNALLKKQEKHKSILDLRLRDVISTFVEKCTINTKTNRGLFKIASIIATIVIDYSKIKIKI
jgi:hypothetical protein